MEFSNFKKSIDGNKTIFTNIQALTELIKLKYYKDDATGNFSKKEFRWSFDTNYWSPWVVLSQGSISSVNIGDHIFLYLEIRYTSSSSGEVDTFTLTYDGPVQIISEPCSCSSSDYTPSDKSVNIISSQQYTVGDLKPINADTLNSKDPDYYIWRPNHKGKQSISTITDLQRVLTNLTNSINLIESSTGGMDLSDYATKIFVTSQGYLTEHQDLSGYATENFVLDKNYLTEHQDLSGYATENFVLDKNYLTEHQDLSGYALISAVFSGDYMDLINAPTSEPISYIDGLQTILDNKANIETITRTELLSSDIDFNIFTSGYKILTSDTVLSFSNPIYDKVVVLTISGNFTITLPESCEIYGEYDITTTNYLIIYCENSSTPNYIVNILTSLK